MAQKTGPKILVDLLQVDKQDFKSKTASKGLYMQQVVRACIKKFNANPDEMHGYIGEFLEA